MVTIGRIRVKDRGPAVKKSSLVHFPISMYTVLVLIKLTKFAVNQLKSIYRNRNATVAVPVNSFFDIISYLFAKFKNVVHSLEPDETPSNSASHQAPNYVQRY